MFPWSFVASKLKDLPLQFLFVPEKLIHFIESHFWDEELKISSMCPVVYSDLVESFRKS
jgi:hypothetical protein